MNRYIKLIWLVPLVLMLLVSNAYACLTFCLQHEKDLVYGRNFDWEVGSGAVIVNQRHVHKTAFVIPPDKPVTWVSKYGSVTFNQFSREVPIGGMNEKGLVIECLVSRAEYPSPDKRDAINELQWIQYQLDTCSTVDEVIKSAQGVRISPYAVNLHYFITDASGISAVIEYIDGKILYRSGKSLPTKVLANTSYDSALNTKTLQDDRFARCASIIQKYDGKKNAVVFAFDVLDEVSQGDFTKWQVVYNISDRRIWFRTLHNKSKKQIILSDFDFEHGTETLIMDVNIDEEGTVRNQFKRYTAKLNDELINAAIEEYNKAGIMQHVTPDQIEFIRAAVDSCRREEPINGNEEFEL